MARGVATGDVQSIRSLIQSGRVSPLAEGRNSLNWLAIAIQKSRKDSFDSLLELGALGRPDGTIAGHAMYAATLASDLYYLKRLYEVGASLNNRGGGELLLAVAMNSRNKAVFEFYLSHGANLEMPTTSGGTILSNAVDLLRFDLANELLDRGASPWVMDSFGTCIGFAAHEVDRLPGWMPESSMGKQRIRFLRRLQDIGYPDPPPTPD